MNNIEILEDYIEALRKPKPFKHTNEQKAEAIENLIKENKELKEKNKKWEELYDEDQEYITQLNNKIFQLETDNKKLDKENQGLFEAYNFNDTNLLAKILKEYRKQILSSVLKSKIREKIEWYEEACKHLSKNGIDLDRYDQYQGAIEALKKLLEEGDK